MFGPLEWPQKGVIMLVYSVLACQFHPEIFQGKLQYCCWFPEIPKSQYQWRHGYIVQKSHHPKDDSQDLTNQSSVLQVFEKKAAKGKGVTPIFVYLFSPSITDHSRSTLHPSILCLSIDLFVYLFSPTAVVQLFNPNITHRHPFATWYITLQNTPRWHPEHHLKLQKWARTATPLPDP
jgi:hypothetical protein